MANYTLIIEDHPLYREGLSDILGSILSATVILKASSAEEGLLLAEHLQDVRLICLDLGLPDVQGSEAVALFRRKFPNAVLIVVSGNETGLLEEIQHTHVVDACIPKSALTAEIIATVHQAMAGDWRMPIYMQSGRAERAESLLTTRQSEVLNLLDKGLSNKQIARHLDVAEVTVKLHVTGIFRAFGVNCRTKALLVARQLGLIAAQ